MSHLYIFKLEEDYHFQSEKVSTKPKEDLEFCGDKSKLRLRIATDGTITVKEGYAWDGCSPKLNVLDLFWVGTPDGAINENKPVTYYASLLNSQKDRSDNYKSPIRFIGKIS